MIKCEICQQEFDPSNLSSVAIHLHVQNSEEAAALAIGIKGKKVGEKESGMEELKIYRFQAKHIEDTFRLIDNAVKCREKTTSLDRDVMQAWQMIKNVLSGHHEQHVPRL